MDIVRKKPNKTAVPIKALLICGVAGLLVWAATSASNISRQVSAESVLTDVVTRGDFNIDVRGIGTLVPKEVHFVATEVSGRVDKIMVKAGAKVMQGDTLVRLTNAALKQQLEESQWELEETQAQLNAQLVSLESQVLDQETLVINSQLNYERTLLTLNAQETLLNQGIVAISNIDHEEVKIEVAQLKQRWELEQKRHVKSKENQEAQKRAFDARLTRMRRSVARIQRLVDNLEIRASIDSVVQEMPLELGQQVTAGSSIARLARSGEFIAEIRIPEKQIYQIALEHPVTIDTKTTKVAGKVIRIDPAVVNGAVQVDVEITGKLPREARPELTVDGTIHVAQIDNTLHVKRPMLAKASSTGEVYVVNPENNHVTLREIVYGRSSQTHIEIKNGLFAGDNVVVSDVSSWKEQQIQAIQ